MSIIQRFHNVLHSYPDRKILAYKKNKTWNWITRNKLKNNIFYCIDVLKDNGVTKTNRVVYKGKNSIEWVSWNLATNAIGAVWIPLYHNQNDNYVNHVIDDSSPKIFINDNKLFESKIKNKLNIISNKIEDFNYNGEIPINNTQISSLIYSSGTTGKPKGVILSNENILSNIDAIQKRFYDLQYRKQYTTLNILPWAHIYGLTTELYYNLLNNNKIAISDGPESFVNELREIQPDLLYLVPRILQLIKKKLEFFDKPIIRYLLPLIIKRIFGSNLITIFVGGSQLDQTTKQFYINNGIKLCEGYGCTETAPMVSVNHISNPRNINSIGKIMDNVVVKIIDDEICVSGPNVMMAYWNNPEATKKALFFHDNRIFYRTGDSGSIDENNFLYYNGRISENYKLSNGKFVNVNDIENKVKKYTSYNFIVYGNNKDYNIVITEKDTDLNDISLGLINKELDSYLKIKYILKLPNGSFQEFLTPKMSIKRRALENNFQKEIENMYK
jgi:long-chain acyl-CoA synthetase